MLLFKPRLDLNNNTQHVFREERRVSAPTADSTERVLLSCDSVKQPLNPLHAA